MRFQNIIACLLLAVGLTACSAALVPLSFDPKTKLAQAYQLLNEFNRPLPAERLIREAYDIFQTRQDEKGMADAYQLYGFFFATPAVSNWSHIYAKTGFEDGSSYAYRFRTSAEYYSRSAAHYTNIGDFASASAVRLIAARTYRRASDPVKACAAFDQSLEAYWKYMTANPETEVSLPAGYTSFEDLIRDEKKPVGCA